MRREVLEWAAELYEDQLEAARSNWATYRERKRLYDNGKLEREPPRPKPAPTYEECLAKSREIRKKRERDATHRNDSTNPYA